MTQDGLLSVECSDTVRTNAQNAIKSRTMDYKLNTQSSVSVSTMQYSLNAEESITQSSGLELTLTATQVAVSGTTTQLSGEAEMTITGGITQIN